MDVLQKVYGIDKLDEMTQSLNVANQGCLPTASVAVANLTLSTLYKDPSWINDTIVKNYEKRKHLNDPGPYQLAAPMLVAQGIGDKLVFSDLTVEDFNQTCAKYPDSPAHLLLYPGLDHISTMAAALRQIIPWIQDRFEGVSVNKKCTHRTIDAVHGN